MAKEILPGNYVARADGWDLQHSSKGSPSLVVNWKLTVRPAETLPDGTTHLAEYAWLNYQNMYLTDAAIKRTLESLEYMGWTGDDLSELSQNGGGLDANEVEVVVEIEPEFVDPATKKVTPAAPRVKWVNRLGGLRLKSGMDPDDAKAWGMKMRDIVKSVRAKPKDGKATSTAVAPSAAGFGVSRPQKSDDDIPF